MWSFSDELNLLFTKNILERLNIQLADNICLILANGVNNVKEDLGQLY